MDIASIGRAAFSILRRVFIGLAAAEGSSERNATRADFCRAIIRIITLKSSLIKWHAKLTSPIAATLIARANN